MFCAQSGASLFRLKIRIEPVMMEIACFRTLARSECENGCVDEANKAH
jgi:hypothetical protein